MKKVVMMIAIVGVLMLPMAQAKAVVPVYTAPVSFASFPLASNIGAMFGAAFVVWAFPYLNTTGYKPYEAMFSSVDYSYPGDKPQHKARYVSHGFGPTYHQSVGGVDTVRTDGF